MLQGSQMLSRKCFWGPSVTYIISIFTSKVIYNSWTVTVFFPPSGLKFLRALNTKGFEHWLSNRDNEMSYRQCFDHSSISNVKPSLCDCIFIQKHLPCFCCQVKSDSWKDSSCQCLSSGYFDGAQKLFFRTNLPWLILLWFLQTQAGSLMGLAFLPFSPTVMAGLMTVGMLRPSQRFFCL